MILTIRGMVNSNQVPRIASAPMTIDARVNRPTFEEFEADCDRKRGVLAQRLSHITPPAGATTVGPWCDEDGQGHVARNYIVTERTIGRAVVTVHGMQAADGSGERPVWLSCSRGTSDIGELDAAGARALAAALLDAAELLDAENHR